MPSMHWYNFFTVVVAVGAAVLTSWLSYIGTQWATRRQLQDALAARLHAEDAEHRQWVRDQAAAVYVDLIRFEAEMSDKLKLADEPDSDDDHYHELTGIADAPATQLIYARAQVFAEDSVKAEVARYHGAIDGLLTFTILNGDDKPASEKREQTFPARSRKVSRRGTAMQEAIRTEVQMMPTERSSQARYRLDWNQRLPDPETGAPSAEPSSD